MNSSYCKCTRICTLILPRKLHHPYIWILTCISALLCTNLYASDACYPDQYFFENSCSTATPLGWETDNPDDPIGNNSNKTIVVTGGVLPFTVQVEGNGFWLDPEHSVTSAEINTRSFTIYTSEACGSGTFSIADGCSSINGTFKSYQGIWTLIATVPGWVGFPEVGTVPDEDGYEIGSHYIGIIVRGQYKYEQNWSITHNFFYPAWYEQDCPNVNWRNTAPTCIYPSNLVDNGRGQYTIGPCGDSCYPSCGHEASWEFYRTGETPDGTGPRTTLFSNPWRSVVSKYEWSCQ